MPPLTFNPGPSKLSDDTKQDIRDAIDLGIGEMSHRSKAFGQMSMAVEQGLRTFMAIPPEYHVFYVASATEAMELTIRNVVEKKSSHFTAGRFAELFADMAEGLFKNTQRISAPWGTSPAYDPTKIDRDTELITITMNETSTGTMCHPDDIQRIREGCPDALLAVDITSIAAMMVLPIAMADVWVFSVQKGFGLPGGLGIMIVSPRALARSLELQERKRNLAGTFRFAAMQKFMQKGGQTICTPNVLNIYLLQRQLERWNANGGCGSLETHTREKARRVYEAAERHTQLHCFVRDPKDRSVAVACIEGSKDVIASLHEKAAPKNVLIGKGYGKLKETTIRIALFPAITMEDVERMLEVLS